MAASGGYWLACAADEIIADPSSIVGSIGVISSGFGFQDLIARIDRVQREYEAAETARLRIAMLVDETKGDVARALADPIADVATVVTPLSDHAREVSHRVHAIAPDTNGARGDRWAWLPVWLDDLAYAPHWPVIAGFTFVYIVIAPRLFIISLRDGFVLTAVTVVCGAVAWLVARVLRPAVPSFPTPLRRASLLLLFAVTLTPVAFVMFLPTMSGVQLLVSAVATVPLATLGAVVPTTMATDVARRDAQQRDLQSRLAVVSCKAEVAAAELRQAQAQARTELHGSVQGRAQAAIAAAALSARGVNDAEPVAEEALRALAEWANTAQPEHPLEGADPIDCAIRPWDGVLTVDASIAGDIDWAHRLRAAECIQDALVNAVRHGRATAVTVDVATTSKGIDIVVTDNGVGPGAITPGLGLCRIEEAGGTWSLTPGAEGGARLVVRLPEPLNREPLNRER